MQQALYRLEYMKYGERFYRDYSYYNSLDQAKAKGEELKLRDSVKRLQITIIPVNGE